jgi:hypothetical protein
MGLTASEDSYTIRIFLNCSYIHYLRSVKGLTFQLFHTFDRIMFKYWILIKLLEVKKKVDKMPKDYIFFTFFYLDCLFNH